jgi:hypothetical protein
LAADAPSLAAAPAPKTAGLAPSAAKSAAGSAVRADPACQQAVTTSPLCSGPGLNPNQVCSYLPPDTVPQRGYTSFSCIGQVQFDTFSWQTLVALNWPADSTGKPCTQPGPGCPFTTIAAAPTSAPRVWDYYLPANQVIPTTSEFRVGSFPGATTCGARTAAKGAPPVRVLTMTSKSDGSTVPDIIQPFTSEPLIDRNLNYTMYEILINQEEAKYIVNNRLNTVAGQEAAKVIDFPCGGLPGGENRPPCLAPAGNVGAIEIKAAWRLLDPAQDDVNSYFWREQDLYISAEKSADHKPFCIAKAKLGLVGIHILHKTASRPTWIWSTFEHRDNVPQTTSATACVGPTMSGPQKYSYFNAACVPGSCVPNQGPKGPADGNFLWTPRPPYAQLYATRTASGYFGTNAVRCQPVAENSPSSPMMDARWYPQLGSSVWKNYILTGTQWSFGYTGAPPFPPQNARCLASTGDLCAPPYLLDSVLETYMQPQVDKTKNSVFANGCIQCHNLAKTVGTNKKPADFSFLLGRVGGTSAPPPPPHHP